MTRDNKLSRLLNKAIQRARDAERGIAFDWKPDVPLPEEPSYMRYLKKVSAPVLKTDKITIEQARDKIWEAFMETTAEKRVLLVRVMPGVGKTHKAVELAEFFAEQGYRVLYAAPRHNMFPELMKIAKHPDWWYEWLARQFGDEEKGDPQTCQYAPQIDEWMKKGHDAMNFCSGVCGWDYVNKVCPYHKQKKTQAKIIFGQHQHVALGHPLPFDVVIGDETPVGAFPNEWRIPSRFILPDGMDAEDPLTHILHIIQAVSINVDESKPVFGPELIDMLGGADELLSQLESVDIPLEDVEKLSRIHNAGDVGDAPYFHIFHFARLLKREAELYQAGIDYPHRMYITRGFLTLLLRRTPQNMPDNIIWLDATGNERIYQALFGRPVKTIDATVETQGAIVQIVDRAWGKTATEKKGDQLDTIVREIAKDYKSVSVIGFLKFVERYKDDEHIKVGHFYAARGTNEHKEAECIIVAGTPQANIYGLVWLAKMVFWERDRAFDIRWTVKDAVYDYIAPDGLGRAYPIAGFWHDEDLQAILHDNREQEILQAVHRGRPVSRADCITYLIASTPVTGLEPTQIVTSREIFEAPEGVNLFQWIKVKTLMQSKDAIGIGDIEELGICNSSARKYLRLICHSPGWESGAVRIKRGQPLKIALKKPLTQ